MSNRVRIHRQNTGKMPVPRPVAARLSNQGCKAFEAGELNVIGIELKYKAKISASSDY